MNAELETTVVPVTAGDGHAINVHHVTGPTPPTREPVLLVHGAGVRSNIFRPPGQTTLVDLLVAAGHDVWLENWRASIDLAPCEWTLDQAAEFDHPAAVQAVLDHTGADTMQAVVHCQGSTSFTMSAVAGLVPQVRTIVSNAVSLHPVIPSVSKIKLLGVVPAMAKVMPYMNPRWGLDPPDFVAKALVGTVKVTHHECDNIVCRMVSFTYGTGFPCLWSHENLTDETHAWIAEEFADVPLTFFRQMGRCVSRGHLVTVDEGTGLPSSVVASPPRTDARFVLLAGQDNHCFLAESQERTFAFLDGHRPGYHAVHVLPGYGHLDVFLGKDASHDIFPLILQELDH